MRDDSSPSVDRTDVRVAIVRADLKLHEFAAIVRIHPGYLGQVLRGHRPINASLAERILTALKTLDSPKA